MSYQLILRITVPGDHPGTDPLGNGNEIQITDALNETLYVLAEEGVIDDTNDDAWEYLR